MSFNGVVEMCEFMKKFLFIYFLAAVVGLLNISCSDDDSVETELTPYAALRSFSISNLKAYYHVKTAAGTDSVATKTVVSSNYPFVIDQKTAMVYNPDSLPYGTDVTKVPTGVESDGLAYYYDEESLSYVPYAASDSIDFTAPVRLLVTSLDAANAREYEIRVNVHKVNPDSMVWNSVEKLVMHEPQRAIVADERMFLFGRRNDGSGVLSSFVIDNKDEIETVDITGLPDVAELGGVLHFNNKFYLVAEEALFISSDGADWAKSEASGNFKALVSASDATGRLWAVVDGKVTYSTDGVSFVASEQQSEGFPLYGISSVEYPLHTNPNILRNVVVGCSAPNTMQPTVWSILSTEKKWVEYVNNDERYICPAISDITVFRYDGVLYAIGGSGVVAGKEVAAFSVVYTSSNDGLTWLPADSNSVSLPASINGYEAPFAVAVDGQNRIWLFVGGNDASSWCGRINRLGF